jgi:hypothetical protein
VVVVFIGRLSAAIIQRSQRIPVFLFLLPYTGNAESPFFISAEVAPESVGSPFEPCEINGGTDAKHVSRICDF